MLATTTKYALRALGQLYTIGGAGFTQVRQLGESCEVPAPYLSKIMKALGARGIVETKKGLSGGVRLVKRDFPLTLFDVCLALEDPVVTSQCLLSKAACNSASPCSMHSRWAETRGELIRFLQESKVGELSPKLTWPK